jgi:hypothetical protein
MYVYNLQCSWVQSVQLHGTSTLAVCYASFRFPLGFGAHDVQTFYILRWFKFLKAPDHLSIYSTGIDVLWLYFLPPADSKAAEGLESTFWAAYLLQTLLKSDTKKATYDTFDGQWHLAMIYVTCVSQVAAQVWHPWNVSHCDTMWHYIGPWHKKLKKCKITRNRPIEK